MFGLGFWEIVVIAVVALLFIGPDRLPKFFRALGRATREFQRASKELRENLSIDEPPPRRPAPRPQRPAADLRAESSEPRPTSRVLEMPRLPRDEWPAAPAAKAESKPGEPFDEIPHPVREVPTGTSTPASPTPTSAEADLPPTAHRPPPPSPPPIMTSAPPPPTPTPTLAPTPTTTKEGKG